MTGNPARILRYLSGVAASRFSKLKGLGRKRAGRLIRCFREGEVPAVMLQLGSQARE